MSQIETSLVNEIESPGAPTEGAIRGSQTARWRRMVLLLAVLAVAGLMISRGITKGEFHLNTDEAHHAATGLFFADLLSDLPLKSPVHYAYVYYAHYPVLSLVHWPPFFYLLEGLTFLTLGPSVVSARLLVLLFALFGFYFWFKLIRESANEWTAALSTLVLAFLPFLLLYERAVMLEVPSLALSMAASYLWIKYLEEEQKRYAFWFAALASLALLTKQNSIYLGMFCLLTAIARGKWRVILKRDTIVALGLFLVAVGPYYVLATRLHWKDMAYSIAKRSVEGNPYVYYWTVLPGQLGLLLLGLSLIGMATSLWWAKRETVLIMLAWIASCYITFTLLAGKEPRYIVYWLPPFVYFAVGPFTSGSLARRIRPVAVFLAVALLVSRGWVAWSYERPYLSGYAPAAKWITQNYDSGIVLYDADLAANFCFFLRAYDPARRYIVLRKALYAVRENKDWGSTEFVRSVDDLQALIDRYGIKYIVLGDIPLDFKSQQLLREYVQTPRFKVAAFFPIHANVPKLQGHRLVIYENLDVKPVSSGVLRITLMTLNRDIEVSLGELGLHPPVSRNVNRETKQ